ncbi:MAG: histidine kinase N-terminal 7TM domain-containing protein [Nocardioidaceae bacterium]
MPSPTALRRIAWTVFVVSTVLVLSDVVVGAQSVSLLSETAVAVHGFPFIHGAGIGSALMGALIVSRHDRHPIGWLLSAAGLCTAISLVTEAYSFWVLEADGPEPVVLGHVAAWVAQLFGGQVIVALLAAMFLLAPDGRFVSPRWRWSLLVPATGAALCLAAVLTTDPRSFELIGSDDVIGPVREVMLSLGFTLISIGVLLGLVSMLRRLRGSTGDERQQLRPIALSAGLAATGLLVLFVIQLGNGGQQTWASGVPLSASFLLMPILFAVAVLRYRLYDLDVIINRTVVVAAGAAFAAVGYTTLVVLVGRVVEGRAGGFWLSLLGTVLVALAFQPLRRVVVRLANRLAYGDRAQPYEALADLSRRLSEAPDPDDLLPAVAEAAARAVSARGARTTLDIPGAQPASGTWGWWAADHETPADQVVAVRTEGRELGRIEVALPRGRTLRPTELRLLEALADQTAVAFRNTSLAGAVAERVAELAATTARLDDSRRRLIAADDAARRDLEAAIARDVLPFLASLPQEIGRERDAVAAGRGADVERLVGGATDALEALRELTRGVFPAQLTGSGLVPALRSLVTRTGEAELSVGEAAGRRWPPRVETAVFFCCARAVPAARGPVRVELDADGEELTLRIRGALPGLDLAGIRDRVDAAGGELVVSDALLELVVPPADRTDSALLGFPVDAGGLHPGR